MAKIEWSNSNVYDLLVRMDGGYIPNEEERSVLAGRTSIDLSFKRITALPESIGELTALKSLDLRGMQIAALPESIGELKALESLYLSSTPIAVLPENIGKLTALENLDLRHTPIAALPESIGKLTALESLNLWDTRITALPESIWELTSLKSLDLDSTQIAALPESIGNLNALKTLDLSFTRISALPESIGELTALKTLILRRTRISALPESIGNLTALESLDLSFTQIAALPESIGELTSLESLNLWDTRIAALPESIRKLTALEYLDLGGTQITALPESIGNLTALEKLYLKDMQINTLSESIRQLKLLEALDLENTNLTSLPEWIGEFPNLRCLDLAGLKLDMIPRSLGLKGLPFVDKEHFNDSDTGVNLRGVTLSKQDVSIFLETPTLIPSLYEGDNVTLRECKVIFLGDGDSGKSYTIRRIENKGIKADYDTRETPGVEISDWEPENEDGLKIHFWDFGGQELLHSMHRCFLTDKTCYVVTVKSRETKADIRARYWLSNVAAFAPDSPVILFINCWDKDDGKRVIDETRLRRDFKNIKKVVYCSAKEATQRSFNQRVGAAILSTLKEVGYHTRLVDRKWVEVASDIIAGSRGKPYITKEDYHKICEERGIKDDNASDLLSFMNNIGVCFSYHRNSSRKELAKYRLLRPVWLTNAVYAIIKEGMDFAVNGRIPLSGVRKILCEPSVNSSERNDAVFTDPTMRYQKRECGYIIDVAAKHELCYDLKNGEMFFPALLRKNTPKTALNHPKGFPDAAVYRFKYKYLPDSVVHKLMIRLLSKDIDLKSCWLRGVMIGILGDYKAIIRMDDDDDKTLHVEVFTRNGKLASEFFSILRNEVLEVNKSLNLSAEEAIADGDDEFPMASLIKASRSKKEMLGRTGKEYDAFELLNRFYTRQTIDCMETDSRGSVIIQPYHYCKCLKSDKALRRAVFEAHEERCGYCGKPLYFEEMEIDHVLAVKYLKAGVKDKETRMYLAELKSSGFDIKKPDYIENYLPSCHTCNNKKNNKTFPLKKLLQCHEKAREKASRVRWLKDKYEREFNKKK